MAPVALTLVVVWVVAVPGDVLVSEVEDAVELELVELVDVVAPPALEVVGRHCE